MAVFEHSLLLLELKALPPTEKRKLRSAVTDNGGTICYVVNKQVGRWSPGLLTKRTDTDVSMYRLPGLFTHSALW